MSLTKWKNKFQILFLMMRKLSKLSMLPRFPWDKNCPRPIKCKFKSFLRDVKNWSISESHSPSTSVRECKPSHLTSVPSLEISLGQNWFHTPEDLPTFQSTPLPPFRFLELKKHSSELWRPREKPQNMVLFSTQLSLEEHSRKTRVESRDTSQTNAQLLAE